MGRNQRIALTAGVFGMMVVAGWAQVPLPPPRAQISPRAACLHESPSETAAEKQRRDDALAAVHLTDQVVAMGQGFPGFRPSGAPYPSWAELAVPGARLGRMDGGPMGRLARQIDWGSGEPLPGWRVHYVADRSGYSLSMTDSRDPCGWTYFGDERGVVAQGYVLSAPERFVPVDSQ